MNKDMWRNFFPAPVAPVRPVAKAAFPNHAKDQCRCHVCK